MDRSFVAPFFEGHFPLLIEEKKWIILFYFRIGNVGWLKCLISTKSNHFVLSRHFGLAKNYEGKLCPVEEGCWAEGRCPPRKRGPGTHLERRMRPRCPSWCRTRTSGRGPAPFWTSLGSSRRGPEWRRAWGPWGGCASRTLSARPCLGGERRLVLFRARFGAFWSPNLGERGIRVGGGPETPYLCRRGRWCYTVRVRGCGWRSWDRGGPRWWRRGTGIWRRSKRLQRETAVSVSGPTSSASWAWAAGLLPPILLLGSEVLARSRDGVGGDRPWVRRVWVPRKRHSWAAHGTLRAWAG